MLATRLHPSTRRIRQRFTFLEARGAAIITRGIYLKVGAAPDIRGMAADCPCVQFMRAPHRCGNWTIPVTARHTAHYLSRIIMNWFVNENTCFPPLASIYAFYRVHPPSLSPFTHPSFPAIPPHPPILSLSPTLATIRPVPLCVCDCQCLPRTYYRLWRCGVMAIRGGGRGGGKNRGNSRFCLRLDRNDPDFPANYDYSEGGGRERGKRKEFGERSIIGGGGEGGLWTLVEVSSLSICAGKIWNIVCESKLYGWVSSRKKSFLPPISRFIFTFKINHR